MRPPKKVGCITSLRTASAPQVTAESDQLTIAQFADLFGFPPAAVLEAVQRNQRVINKPFDSIPDLASRWCMSRASVYNVLREHEARIVDFAGSGRTKGKKVVYADVVERIEKQRTKPIEEAA